MKRSAIILGIAVLCAFPAPAKQTRAEATDSLKEIRDKASAGDPAALNEAGMWYYTGRHVAKDYKKAVKFWEEASKKGSVLAIGNLGLCYQYGHGVAADSLKAAKFYTLSLQKGNKALMPAIRKSADEGNVFSAVFAAHCLLNGIGTPKDNNAAVAYLKAAARRGSERAQFDLGKMYLKSDKLSEAYKYLEMAAGHNNVEAIYYCGRMLQEGNGVAKNPAQGANYMLRAAEAGYPLAEYRLGKAYMEGYGLNKNVDAAAQWLLKGAMGGVKDAQFEIALCYATGTGVDQNFENATSWFAQAVAQGEGNAFKAEFAPGGRLAGSLYQTYLYALKAYAASDFKTLKKHIKTLHKAKISDAETIEGMMLSNKGFSGHNEKKAIKALSQAAANGNAYAKYIIGRMYEQGNGFDKDYDTAILYLTEAADENCAQAAIYLGNMYFEGRGVDRNLTKALDYYMKAEGRLDNEAATRIAEICKTYTCPALPYGDDSIKNTNPMSNITRLLDLVPTI